MSNAHQSGKLVYLMYHELERAGRPLSDPQPGYARYCVAEDEFKRQMGWLRTHEWHAVSVPLTISGTASPAVVITFDDGAETDLIAAAPILKEAGYGATFYITTGFLGKRGYLSQAQVRELADLGFDIGCHSRTHPYLSDLRADQLKSEISEPKVELEQMIGRSVAHFSCPGGRWNPLVVEAVKQAGYQSMATSQARSNAPGGDVFSLGRVAVMRDASLASFSNLCMGRGLWKLRMAEQARAGVKHLLGNTGYDRLRAILLGRPEPEQ